MKFRLFCLLLILALLLAAPAWTAAGPGLSPAQLKSLKTLHVPVLVPYYLPTGFKAEAVKVQPHETDQEAMGYQIQYSCQCKGKKYMFVVEGTSGGVGDADADASFAVPHKVLGKITIDHFKPGGNIPGMRHPFYRSQWIGNGPMSYSFVSGNGRIDSPYPPLDKTEVVKIVQSLGYLN